MEKKITKLGKNIYVAEDEDEIAVYYDIERYTEDEAYEKAFCDGTWDIEGLFESRDSCAYQENQIKFAKLAYIKRSVKKCKNY